MKALCLAFLGLLAAKAVGSAYPGKTEGRRQHGVAVRSVLHAAILILVGLSAWNIGYDVAAEIYAATSRSNLARREFAKSYSNALRAVELRPGNLWYWRGLVAAKFALRQYSSMATDLAAFRSLGGGKLDEEDAYRLAAAYYFQAQYEKVIPLTQELIAENRAYAAPYVLQGYAYTAQKRFAEAERTFLDVLRMFPTQQLAVEGLAHLYFLGGNKAGALDILNQTAKFPFPPESRPRFEALKALYAQ